MLTPSYPVPQNVTQWGDKVFRGVIKLKRDPEELPSFKMAAVSVDRVEG